MRPTRSDPGRAWLGRPLGADALQQHARRVVIRVLGQQLARERGPEDGSAERTIPKVGQKTLQVFYIRVDRFEPACYFFLLFGGEQWKTRVL